MKYLAILLFGAMLFSCEEEQPDKEELQANMQAIEVEIENIISKECSESSQCQAAAIGTKPCGGPTHYIIYGSVTSETELNELIEQYNALNKQLNEVTDAVSDCAIVNPPMLECSSGMCVEIE